MPYTMTMPKLSPTMESGVITKWCRQVVVLVKDGDLILEVATDKATVEHHILDGGWLRKILVPEGKSASVNEPIAIFTATQHESIEGYIPEGIIIPSAPPAQKIQEVPSFLTSSQRVVASPLARKIAREKKIDITSLQGSGPGGRIVSRDLPVTKHISTHPTPTLSGVERVPLTPLRKIVSTRLQTSKTTIPHFYTTLKIDAAPLFALRQDLVVHDQPLSYNDLILTAVALSLRDHPNINCGCDGEALLRFLTIDISVAVSIPGGLITPIIFNADTKTPFAISAEVKALVQRAKEGKLLPEEYQGGSFTVSNLGMWGVSAFDAIINPPQGAILAIGSIIDEPVVRSGVVVAGKTLTVTLSADHRIIDGADAAAFLKTLQKHLEHPARLLLF